LQATYIQMGRSIIISSKLWQGKGDASTAQDSERAHAASRLN